MASQSRVATAALPRDSRRRGEHNDEVYSEHDSNRTAVLGIGAPVILLLKPAAREPQTTRDADTEQVAPVRIIRHGSHVKLSDRVFNLFVTFVLLAVMGILAVLVYCCALPR